MSKYNLFFKHRKSGSVFVVVIAVLGIIIFAASYFMASTIEEGRQVSMSVRGLHASSLAEASLERAMRILTENINNIDLTKTSADDLSIKVRLPAPEGSSTLGQSENLGSDKELKLTEAMKKEMVMTKDDLQKNGENELDKLVDFMTEKGAKSYEVTVKAKVSQAFRNSPGKNLSDYKVPGVDIGWNTRYDVKNFLDGKGYTAFEISFPKDWKWLDLHISVAGGLIDIDLIKFVDVILEAASSPITAKEISSIDFVADFIFKKLEIQYPYEVKMDKQKMPTSVAELWPSGTSVSEGANQYLEKYGQITIEAEAKITYQDGYTSARRVAAVKDFKVADCEPPASMYSLFISNMLNDYIMFNCYGGPFFVNNCDYSGAFGKIKDMVMGSDGKSNAEIEANEIPGLIRVNYKENGSGGLDGKNPLMCNIGFIGDPFTPGIEGSSLGGFMNMLGGMEAALIATTKSKMIVGKGDYKIVSHIAVKDPETNEKRAVNIMPYKDSSKVKINPYTSKNIGDYSIEMDKMTKDEIKKYKETHGGKKPNTTGLDLKSKLENTLNLIPNIAKLSTNVITLAIYYALGDAISEISFDVVSTKNPFQKWEWPWMGTSWNTYTLPTTGTGDNKSHLFGYGGLYPTLTKEIEGDVMKVYRQWSMCIVGWDAKDRIPIPTPAGIYNIPPWPIPIWSTSTVVKKYGYNIGALLPNSEDGDADNKAHEYDPELAENMPPNLYTDEQYVKKATYYYESAEAFKEDFPNRTTKVGDKTVFLLKGVTYIAGSMGSDSEVFKLDDIGDTLYVAGKGMIVCGGNLNLGFNIKMVDVSPSEKTVFSLICRNGGLIITENGKQFLIEGSLYTQMGIYIVSESSLHIVGNWVTDKFDKICMRGTVVVDYVSSRCRSSFGSLHPTRGKYDPKRYYVSVSPTWAAWRAY